MASVPRSIWIDDSGSGTDGTILANSELQTIYDNVDAEVRSTNFPSLTTKSIQDNFMAAAGFHFGSGTNFYRATALPVGSTYNFLAPGTGIWRVDSAWLTGTWRWEAVLDYETGSGITVSACLVNLTDDPNTALAGSLITATTQTGQFVRSSPLTFALAGVTKDYAVKVWTNTAGNGGRVRWARALRTA